MKRGLFNIEGNTITPLIEEGVDSGSISSVRMTNTSTASVVVELTIDEGVNKSHLVQTTIPAKTTLLVDDELGFNNSIFSLNLKTTSGSQLGSSTPLSVIIK